ncbi:MurT ligase domain-containing protein [Jatrophihabitans lederbergiae]|uniref:Lipid II isoglutaminyl synthase (glutamine-hydrolyzing) subunit MurT n=1 Tax=Jatrophihabitans lederbergiae TaxID=3075547 RepID=A0ABU2JB63_9ACTN|nr:MurT ligase domain-containing protein [Jatrophihabitans sp. DSM 44399]MDT0262230.1 MurT ligase domain-containing protein [Jatrophihabitans sp. DSM 44399]
MDILAIWLGKLTLLALRALGRRGTALPGLVVEKVFPRFLSRRLARLPEGVIVVSGTNGKTTTTKMVATVLARRYRVLTNDTGGNFVRGTITAVVQHSDWLGRTPADVAVFELDEAHAVLFCQVHQPKRLLLLNVLRDQLDRFGEIDTTARLLGTVAGLTTGDVVLNRDDPRLVALASGLSAEVSYFGVAPSLRELFPTDEEMYGGDIALSSVAASAELLDVDLGISTELTLRIGDAVERITLRAEGAHNAQNAAGAAALALTLGLGADVVAAGLRSVEPAFGRGQSFQLNGRRVVLQLVKNPAGFRQSLRTVDGLRPAATVIAINDDYADGRDMSWLWDVEFAQALQGKSGWLVTSGTRAADMAVRLHYDGVTADQVEPELAGAVARASLQVKHGDTVVVFSTYTAMWQLHQVLTKLSGATNTNTEAVTA